MWNHAHVSQDVVVLVLPTCFYFMVVPLISEPLQIPEKKERISLTQRVQMLGIGALEA